MPVMFGSNPVLFVLVTAFYFGVYGEIFSLFPATQGDTFGSKFAAANAGMLYTAKGTGALLVPLFTGYAKTHGWSSVFSFFVTFSLVAGLFALFVFVLAHNLLETDFLESDSGVWFCLLLVIAALRNPDKSLTLAG